MLGSGFALRGSDIPDTFPEKKTLYPDPAEWINQGDSVVVAPDGALAAGPMRGEQGILYADIDLARIAGARRTLDVAGHYARPDIFRLHVNAQAMPPVEFATSGQPVDSGAA